MNLRRRPLVLLYALGSIVVVAALCIVTLMVVRQQRAHAIAVADALYHEDVRTALWRMDTRVGSLLATTTNRVGAASRKDSTYNGAWIDPTSNRVNAEPSPTDELQQRVIDAADQAYAVACAAELAPSTGSAIDAPSAPSALSQTRIEDRGEQRTLNEYERRQGANVMSQISNASVGPDSCSVGPLAPVWERAGSALNLHMTRRVEDGGSAWHESYRLEWTALQQTLLGEVRDLFPTAQLMPVDQGEIQPEDGRALRLATIPARFVAPRPTPVEGLPRGHLWTLAGAWSALLFALFAGALALRSSYDYAEKHRRFTHAVTHELRTPLTTFRMYSEMLARGMAPEASRAEYLATLESEAARLSRLVDNVLRYARLEDGSSGPPRTVTEIGQLVERCVPELSRTCTAAGTQLEVQQVEVRDVKVATDADAVQQILSNLVENACKYGFTTAESTGAPRAVIVLRASCDSKFVHLDIVDQGPGVPPAIARSIFAPFDRGGRDSSDRAPGVGLGLALARSLARELGGSLTLEPAQQGATFRLSLPR
ncbi:MAG: HAMP domain-containing histidine kinase [Planctomycetes bacterium]|nr:HAMP domain-containing histidine kinase [Planctomycetota bacterium]